MNPSTLWASFLLITPNGAIYCGADSGYFIGYKEIERKYPGIDYALLPVGAYHPRWFMHYAHMDIPEVLQAFDDLNHNAPEGSWAMTYGLPFAPEHRLRADLQMKRLEAEKLIRDGYYQTMFRQFEKTRLLTSLSPLSLFELSPSALAATKRLLLNHALPDLEERLAHAERVNAEQRAEVDCQRGVAAFLATRKFPDWLEDD